MATLEERKIAIAEDLIWSIEEMQAKEEGMRFLNNVSQFLPVYSSALRQLYSSYETYFTKTNVVILPNNEDYTATYSRVPFEAIKNTSILVYPSIDGVLANLRMNNATAISLPLSKAFQLIRSQLKGPFLPVIQRGDLRDYDQLRPCLHLNAFVPAQADSLPRFVRMDMTKALTERVQELQYSAHIL